MTVVRFWASSGSKIVGSRLRTDVPLQSAREQQRGQARPDRGVAPQQRDRDPEEPELRGLHVVRRDPELPAEDVQRPGQAGEQPAGRHDEDVRAPDVDAARPRGLGVEADRPRLVALLRAG